MPELSSGMMVTPSLKLKHLIGEGAMGSVWVADHLSLSTTVAVKFIARDHRQSSREAVLKRFEREARAAAQIKSPHGVHMYDHGVMDNGTPFIVMELLEGETLGARLRRAGPMSVDEVREVIRQVCKALTKAHELDIVHRDIKPDNLFLLPSDDDLFVKVLDFGIAKTTTDPEEAVTTTGATLGTPLYMSPEVVRSARQADYRADLWGLAVVAYEALVGQPPFRGETVGALFFSICGDPIDPPSSRRKGLSRAIDDWFSRALCQEPARRFDSAREMADTFAVAADSAGDVATDETDLEAAGGVDAALLGTAEFISQQALDASVDGADGEASDDAGDEAGDEAGATRSDAPASDAAQATSAGGTSEPPKGLRVTQPAAGSTRETSEQRESTPTVAGAAVEAGPPRQGRGLRLGAAALVAAGLLGGGYFAFSDTSESSADTDAVTTDEPTPVALVPLRIRCEGGCDQVSVDGRAYRQDELEAAALQHGETPTDGELRIKVEPGRHRLRVERVGYEIAAEDIEVLPKVPWEKRYQLTPKKGSLPADVLSSILKRNKTKYWACYETALKREPKLRGTVEVKFIVDPRGNVDDVTTTGIGDEALHRCMQQTFKSIGFPAPEGGGVVEVTYPLHLEPAAPTNTALAAPSSKSKKKKTSKNTKKPPQKKAPSKKKKAPPANDDMPQQQQKEEPQQVVEPVQQQSKPSYEPPPPDKSKK